MNKAEAAVNTNAQSNDEINDQTGAKRQSGKRTSSWADYYELTKPRVVMLLLLTALVGMCLATPTWVEPVTLIAGMLGIGLLSSAAAVINHVVDHKIDSVMARTFNRPVAKG